MTWMPRTAAAYHEPQKLTRFELHERTVTLATKLYKRFGVVYPTWTIAAHNPGDGLPSIPHGYFTLVVETAWVDENEKLRAVDLMRRIINAPTLGAYAYSFFSEAWMAHEKKGDRYDKLREQGFPIAPGDRPANDRDDIMMVLSFERDTTESVVTRYLTYDRGGPGKNILGARDDTISAHPDSRLSLFPQPNPDRSNFQ